MSDETDLSRSLKFLLNMETGEITRGPLPEFVPTDYSKAVEPYRTAIDMVRDAIGELFGPVASLESDEATLLRGGPEPTHDAEAIIAALQRVSDTVRRLKIDVEAMQRELSREPGP